MKVKLSPADARRLLEPGPVALVTASWKGRPNIMTAAWVMPLSADPPLVGLAVSPLRFTHELIKNSEAFALNIPGRALVEKTWLCGNVSGKELDKFEEAGLTPIDAREIEAPLIEECLAHIECGVTDAIAIGDHTLFVGRVVAVSIEEGCFEKLWLLEDEEARPLHHLGADYFAVLEKPLLGHALEERE